VSRLTRVLVGGLVVVVALIVSVALGEVSLRLFYPQPLGVWHHDPAGLALHWPGRATYLPQFGQTVSINSAGMRDREHAVEKSPGVFRILVLGDSFMEALQVPFERSFPSLLERALAQQTGKHVEVVNASVSGWGTDDELQYLETYGRAWKPDLILVAMTLHNDISDNLRERFHTVKGGAVTATVGEPASFWRYRIVLLQGFLATRSHAFQLLNRARRAGEMRSTARQLNSHVVDLFREGDDGTIARGVDLTARLLDRIQSRAAAEGGRVVLVLLPLAMQLSEERFDAFARVVAGSANGSTGRLDIGRPQRMMLAVADRADLPAIDLLPRFRAWTAGGGAELFLQRDGHWSEQGHRLAVEIVVQEMITRGLAG